MVDHSTRAMAFSLEHASREETDNRYLLLLFSVQGGRADVALECLGRLYHRHARPGGLFQK